MSWDQGIQVREDIPEQFRALADRLGEKRGWGEVQCLVWFTSEPNVLILDYGEHGGLSIDFTGTRWAA